VALLNHKRLTAAGLCCILCSLCCSGGDLTQRQANLTKTELSGLWKGELLTPDRVGSQSFLLIFTQDAGFSLDGSKLVGEDIRLGGVVSSDTFALVDGLFTDNEIRFNIAPTADSPIIRVDGIPVLFAGLLTENEFMSGELKASEKLIGFWEAVFSEETPPADGGGEGEGETP
jgi:hypothetical protein